ncbi:MAG: peptidoglycan DD-metalloendopeptidase family protein [Methylococcaceae bacterium]|nr:peptidoglycan DD-metalloendopeptidase family protein [Methylococcaceae bacterium]
MANLKLRLLLILMVFLSGCAEEPVFNNPLPKAPQIFKPSVETASKARNVYTVKKGDTLKSIANRSGLSYSVLSRWNDIPKPYRLEIGQLIKLYDPGSYYNDSMQAPVTAAVVEQNQAPNIKPMNPTSPLQPPAKLIKLNPAMPAVNAAIPPPVTTPKKSSNSLEETSGVSKDKEKMLKLFWKWPIQGKLLKTFTQSGNKGIDIEGKAGESVYAAANGKVVYSGNGLIGYGNLLIIKHDKAYLSAYANNASLQVKEGEKVIQGQNIARCGKSASGIPSVHFEIRKNGKSVNPLLYLPTQ